MLKESMDKSRKERDKMFCALNSGDLDFFKSLALDQKYNKEKKEKVSRTKEYINNFINFIKSDKFHEDKANIYFNCMSELVNPGVIVLSLYFNKGETLAIDLIKNENMLVSRKLLEVFIEEFKAFDFHDDYRMKSSSEQSKFVENEINNFLVLNKKIVLESKLALTDDGVESVLRKKVKV